MKDIVSVEMFKCPDCGEAYRTDRDAILCNYKHAKESAINADFESGYYTLGQIWRKYGGMMKELPKELENITKDNCFVVSYLQCCDYPAYTISHISELGEIEVCGDGGWSGGYCSKVGFHSLADPRPKEELWRYSDKGAFGRNKTKAL